MRASEPVSEAGQVAGLDACDERLSSKDSSVESFATIDVFLDSGFVLHVRVNGVALAPIPALDDDANHASYHDELADEVEKVLSQLTAGHDEGSKLLSYTSDIRRVGLLLGGLLFGYRDVRSSGCAGRLYNELHRTLEQLYAPARDSGRHITITFAAQSAMWNEMPFELALWVWAGEEHHLGIAEHMTFVRRVYQAGFVPRAEEQAQAPLRLRHVSSLPTANTERPDRLSRAEHESIERLMDSLCTRYPRGIARADVVRTEHLQDWRATPSDILQFSGHGTKERTIEWGVEEAGEGAALQMSSRELLGALPKESLPGLFIFIACYSLGFVEELMQHSAGQRPIAGVAMQGSWRPFSGHAERLLRAFHGGLLEHGRLDLAIQRARRALYELELEHALRPGSRVPENWFQPVLLIRDTGSAARFFQPVARDRHDTGS